jgi:broad specificity phosphatase PhoE
MKRSYALIALFLVLACSRPAPPTTFILLRHAEKASDGSDDPDLKAEGIERARRLTELLKDTQVDGIYATNFKRTRQTVELLAQEKKLDVLQYEAFKPEEIENMLHKHRGGTVVVCGHTNNIPWTANLLTGKDEFDDYEETQYGIFMIVTVVEKGSNAKVIRLSY